MEQKYFWCLAILASMLGCQSNSGNRMSRMKFEQLINEEYLRDSLFSLHQVIEEPWDSVYIFGDYTAEIGINAVIRIPYFQEHRGVPEWAFRLVFVQNGEVVNWFDTNGCYDFEDRDNGNFPLALGVDSCQLRITRKGEGYDWCDTFFGLAVE